MWLAGFEEHPEDGGELCVVEVFGRSIEGGSAEIGVGAKQVNDPRLTHDFVAPRLAVDVAEYHTYSVEWDDIQAAFSVDGEQVHVCSHPPTYPMEVMLALFDFPEWSGGEGHVPTLTHRLDRGLGLAGAQPVDQPSETCMEVLIGGMGRQRLGDFTQLGVAIWVEVAECSQATGSAGGGIRLLARCLKGGESEGVDQQGAEGLDRSLTLDPALAQQSERDLAEPDGVGSDALSGQEHGCQLRVSQDQTAGRVHDLDQAASPILFSYAGCFDLAQQVVEQPSEQGILVGKVRIDGVWHDSERCRQPPHRQPVQTLVISDPSRRLEDGFAGQAGPAPDWSRWFGGD